MLTYLHESEERIGLVARGIVDIAVVGQVELLRVDLLVEALIHLPDHLLFRVHTYNTYIDG